jgi:hypothetical protein
MGEYLKLRRSPNTSHFQELWGEKDEHGVEQPLWALLA